MTIRFLSIAVVFLLSNVVLPGQTPSTPSFDAASVKPTAAADGGGSTYQFTPGGGLQITNAPLKGILETAYDVRDFQITGGPGWTNSQGYDIFAKSGPGGSTSAAGVKETRAKLQTLLAERFQLKVHRETQERQVYALAVAKNGPKLKEPDTNAAGRSPAGVRTACGQMVGTSAAMSSLTLMLSRQLRLPVLDRTGLSGKYDFELLWTPDAGPCTEPPPGSRDAPSLFTALQEQLGLKLESTRGPVEMIVIDHAEKAAEN